MGARRIAAAKPAKQKIAEVKEPRISRRLMGRVMVLSLLAGLLGSGVWWLAQPDTLPIEQVRVEGEFRFLKRSDLDMAVGDLASGGFFNVDVRGVKAAVETLPWVDSAAVWRQWPNTLRIAINEQQPLAYWGEGQMLNRRGEIFKPLDTELKLSLPHLSGPAELSRLVAARYQLIGNMLAQIELRVSELRLNERRAWQVQLHNGLQLVLGRAVNDAQLEKFVAVYQQLLSDRAAQMESVDLRYNNGFAVRWKPGA